MNTKERALYFKIKIKVKRRIRLKHKIKNISSTFSDVWPRRNVKRSCGLRAASTGSSFRGMLQVNLVTCSPLAGNKVVFISVP